MNARIGEIDPVLDRVFEVLQEPRRRLVLYHLRDAGQTTVDELTAAVTAWERDEAATDVSSAEVELSLVHTHLPKLASAGFIEYDRRRRVVRQGHRPEQLSDALTLTARWEEPP